MKYKYRRSSIHHKRLTAQAESEAPFDNEDVPLNTTMTKKFHGLSVGAGALGEEPLLSLLPLTRSVSLTLKARGHRYRRETCSTLWPLTQQYPENTTESKPSLLMQDASNDTALSRSTLGIRATFFTTISLTTNFYHTVFT